MKNILIILSFIICLNSFSQSLYIPSNPDSIKVPVNVNGAVRTVYNIDLVKYRAALTARDTAAALRPLIATNTSSISANTTAIGLKADKSATISINGNSQTLGSNPSFTVAGSASIVFNPKDYGATGNGVTNDQTAVQNTINAAHAVSGKVVFPQGTYLVNSLHWYPDVEMAGVGAKGCIIRSATASPLIYYYNTTGIDQPSASISDLYLKGNNLGTIAIDITGVYRTTFNRVFIDSFTTKGVNLLGIVVDIFNNCDIRNVPIGVYLDSYNFGGALGVGQSNLNTFNQCSINVCSSWAIKFNSGAGLILNQCDFEVNGTNGNANTGAINCTNLSPSSEGVGLNMNGGWFERNYGTAILIAAATGTTRNIIKDVIIQFPQTGTTTGVKITQTSGASQKLLLIGATVSGHSTDIVTEGANATTDIVKSTIGNHSELTSGVYNGGSLNMSEPIGNAINGSVLVAGTGGNLGQNNSKFFWDDGNWRLGVGTGSPLYTLHVQKDATLSRVLIANNFAGTPQTDIAIGNTSGTNILYMGVNSGATANAYIDNRSTGALNFQNAGTTIGSFSSTAFTLPSGISLISNRAAQTTTNRMQWQTNGVTDWYAGYRGTNSNATFTFTGSSTLGVYNIYPTTGNFRISPTMDVTDNGTKFHVDGSFGLAYVAKTAAYTVTASDYTVDCNGTFTVTLPTAVGVTGRIYVIKNSGTGTITLAGTSAQTFDGNASPTIATQYGILRIQSNGANWIVL